MMIEILGTGCAKCEALTEKVKDAAELLGIEYDLRKVTEPHEIANRGVMATPALVIDDDVVVNGEVPDEMELLALLSHACAVEA